MTRNRLITVLIILLLLSLAILIFGTFAPDPQPTQINVTLPAAS